MPAKTTTFPPLTTPQKRYSLDEAQAALPLVRRIVADVVSVHTSALALHNRLATPIEPVRRVAIKEEFERTIHRMESLVDELNELGIDLSDYAFGVVGFPAQQAGRDIRLCWQLGETRVGHWRGWLDEPSQRRPIAAGIAFD